MKKSMTALAAIAFAATACVGPMGMARAADISQAPVTIDLSSGSNVLWRVFSAQNDGNTFTDRFNFTAGAPSALTSFVFSFTNPAETHGVALTGFTLYNGAGTALQTGSKIFGAPLNLWTNTASNLGASNYYLLVSGSILGNGGARYDGGVSLAAAPVPEPGTYGMLLGGLGGLGLLARRRKSGPGV